MDTHEWPCGIKSARRKRRLVKTDRDKQLMRLNKRLKELWQQKTLLPMVPLGFPYQRGWKRFFALRADVARGPKAAFYEELLTKVNTVEYHNDKTFKRKKRRKWRYGYEIRQQSLREFDFYSWQSNKRKLTDDEKACFTRVETFDIKTRHADVKYVITEPWRFVLKVMPHMVTHIKLMDADIERELSYIDHHIDNHQLMPRINRLTRGRSYRYRWKDHFNERPKYINKFKNTPVYAYKEAYQD